MLRSAILCLAFCFTTAFAGIHYTATTTITNEANKRANDKMDVEAWIEGDKAKILFKDSKNPMYKNDAYIITTDGGKTMYLVNPKDKTYMEWDMSQMMQMAGAAMGMVQIKFENLKSEKLEDGSGDNIFGYSTRRYKYRTAYDISIKALGMKRVSSVETEQEIWSTTKISDAAMGVWLRNEPPPTGNEDLDALIKNEMQHIKGFPLRTKTKTVTTQWNKKRTKVKRKDTSWSTTELTSLKKESVNAGVFKIPSDYTKTENPLSGEGSPLKGIFNRNN